MKKALLFAAAGSLAALTACNRGPRPEDVEADRRRSEQLQQMDQRIAELRDLEQRAADRKAEKDAQERDRLARERAALQKERDQLAARAQHAEKRADQAEKAADDSTRRADQAREGQTVNFFYAALDPHGEWVDVDRLGYCWRPKRADEAGWRPYTDGQWVFTDYGWTWKSNEPYGWAVYHYGRWARLKRLGWIWVPGTEWGPGWVAWRQSADYIGWAPLPPDAWSRSGFNEAVDSYYDIGPAYYTFVAADSLGEPTYVGRIVQPERNVTIINQTVNVTNITYANVQNTTAVFNGGPNFAEINARVSLKIPKLTVQRITDMRNPAEAPKTQQQGSVLRIAAPVVSGPMKPASPPKRVAQQVRTPEIEHGWAEISDSAAAQRVKEQQQREARQAELRARTPGRVAGPAEAPVRAPQREASTPAAPAPGAPQRPPAVQEPAAERHPEKVPATPRPGARDTGPANIVQPPAREIGSRPSRPETPAPATPGASPAKPQTGRPTATRESTTSPSATPDRPKTQKPAPPRAMPVPSPDAATPPSTAPLPGDRGAATPQVPGSGGASAVPSRRPVAAATPESAPARSGEAGAGGVTPPASGSPAAASRQLPDAGTAPASDRHRPRAVRSRPEGTGNTPASTPAPQ